MSDAPDKITNAYHVSLSRDYFCEIVHCFYEFRVRLNHLCLLSSKNAYMDSDCHYLTVVPKTGSAPIAESCFEQLGYLPLITPIRFRNERIPTIEEVAKLSESRTLFAEPLNYLEFMIAIKPMPRYWDKVLERLAQEQEDCPWHIKSINEVGVVIRPFSEEIGYANEIETFPELLTRLDPSLILTASWICPCDSERYGLFVIGNNRKRVLVDCEPYETYLGIHVARRWLDEGLSKSTLLDLLEFIDPNLIDSMFTFTAGLGMAMLYG